ncbi:MAG TPA: HAMP domain-containing sensor histidine kinase [Patescibacteria group bacterium]|nr:HAMP domain-containing sensor histidine kinase [Patescibacteria group bacterium]
MAKFGISKKRISVKLQFLIMLILLMILVFTAISFVIVNKTSKTLKTNLVNESKSFADLATQPIGDNFIIYQDSGTLHIKQEVNNYIALDSSINQVEIVDSNNKIKYLQDPKTPIKVSVDDLSSIDPIYKYDQSKNLIAIVEPYIQTYGIHQYSIVYGVSYQDVNKNISSIILYITIISISIFIISIILSYILINRLFLEPVSNISHSAIKISKGDFDQKIITDRNDEIGDLAASVETMATSLKRDIDKLKQLDVMKNEFLMITSHNLRTPLTVIEGYIDTLQYLKDPSKINDIIEPITLNINRLRDFSEDVLTISTIESGNYVLHYEDVEFSSVINKIADEFSKIVKQKSVTFNYINQTHAIIKLAKVQFRSAIWNLLDNAIKFTPAGGTIVLNCYDEKDSTVIKVVDSGPGISEKELPLLFTKFHRATDTLKYNYEGTGIGLYISKLIIEKHGGSISVESKLNKGSIFTIKLPLIQQDYKPIILDRNNNKSV